MLSDSGWPSMAKVAESISTLNFHLLPVVSSPAEYRPTTAPDAGRFGAFWLAAHDSGRVAANGELTVFDTIATMPGFVRIMAEFIYELKQNLVYPEPFSEAAQSQKDHELALIYSTYQEAVAGAHAG